MTPGVPPGWVPERPPLPWWQWVVLAVFVLWAVILSKRKG